jgi:hypothetical protein
MRSLAAAIAVGLVFGTMAHGGIITIYTGSFAGAYHYLDSPSAVADYKANAAAIATDQFVSRVKFLPTQSSLWPKPAYNNGGDIYVTTAVTGLQAGDIIKFDTNWLWRGTPSDPLTSYDDAPPFWVLVGDYTHTPGNRIYDWLNFGTYSGTAEYTFTSSSGVYNLVSTEADLPLAIGSALAVLRDVEVYRGATLLNSQTSSRGYSYSMTGITGGTLMASGACDSGPLQVVPEPATLTCLALGLAVWVRRRK